MQIIPEALSGTQYTAFTPTPVRVNESIVPVCMEIYLRGVGSSVYVHHLLAFHVISGVVLSEFVP